MPLVVVRGPVFTTIARVRRGDPPGVRLRRRPPPRDSIAHIRTISHYTVHVHALVTRNKTKRTRRVRRPWPAGRRNRFPLSETGRPAERSVRRVNCF